MNPAFNAPLVLLMQNFFTIAFFVFITICIFLYQSKSKYLIAFLPLLAISSHQFEEYVLFPLLLGDYYHFLNPHIAILSKVHKMMILQILIQIKGF